jgi:hypothetical protein
MIELIVVFVCGCVCGACFGGVIMARPAVSRHLIQMTASIIAAARRMLEAK